LTFPKNFFIFLGVNILDKPLVLRLNANWQALNKCSVRDGLVAMCSGNEFVKAANAISLEYYKKDDGSWDFDTVPMMTVIRSFNEWMDLPIRDYDMVINTSRKAIRAPTVIIAKNYSKMPKKIPKFSKQAIWERDNARCQITGEKLTKETGNIAHLIARANGGSDSFENTALMKKVLNTQQKTRTIEEMGWKLLRKPTAPLPVPISSSIKKLEHRDWKFFINLE
jgi:5-methylcytosine-specific restriction endonuclease McrA